MSNIYVNKLIEFIDEEVLRYVYETYDKIIEKVEQRKSAGKKKANGNVSIGFYGLDVEFTINKNVALKLGNQAFEINTLSMLSKILSKRYSVYHIEYNDVNEITFRFFGFFGNKTKFCKLFIEKLKELLEPCGIKFSSLVPAKIGDAKIKYRCDLSQYKAPVKSGALQTQVKKGLEELLNTYELMCKFYGESTDPITCYSYLSCKNINRNVLLKFTVHTTPSTNSQQLIAIFGISLGNIIDKAKAEAFKTERNARTDRNNDFSIVASDEFFLVKPIVYTDVDYLMEKFEDALAEGAKLLGEDEILAYAEIAEKTYGAI